MAADAGKRATALRHLCGSVVRTARAEIRRAGEGHDIALQLTFLSFEESQPLGDSRRGVKPGNPLRDNAGDLCRRQLAVRRQYPVAVLVELADDARPNVFTPVVELFFELILNDRTFFFYDQNFFQSFSKMPYPLALKGPGHRNFV